MKRYPFLAIFFEKTGSVSAGERTGTETFTEVRREETDRDVEALAPLGTETSTHVRREENDRDLGLELVAAGTETFTRSRGEEGDRDLMPDSSSDLDTPGIWESPIL